MAADAELVMEGTLVALKAVAQQVVGAVERAAGIQGALEPMVAAGDVVEVVLCWACLAVPAVVVVMVGWPASVL